MDSTPFEIIKVEFLEREKQRKEKGLGVGVPYLMDEVDIIAEFQRLGLWCIGERNWKP